MLLERIIAQSQERPSDVAIVDDKRTLTYRELGLGSNIMAGHIEALAPDAATFDKIGLLLPPSAAFAIGFLGARWLNRTVMPLNYLLRPQELIAIAKDSGLKILFTIRHFQPLAEALAPLGVKIVYMEDLSFMRLPSKRPLPTRNPDDVACIMYTSGTSGVPKGVMLTNGNLESNADNAVAHARFNQKLVFLGVLPMFHTLGLQANCLIPLMLGCKCLYIARFSPTAVFDAVAKHHVEVLVAVPSMFALLAGAKSARPDSLASLKYVISGGEPLPVSLIEAFRQKFNMTLYEGFGLTETSPMLAINIPWDFKPGSVGKLLPETQIKVLDEENRPLPPGRDGLLLFKGPQVMKGYFNKPEATAEVISPDGWFNTGDIGHIDADGFLFITGRKKDMIIMAGEKVFPREIEDALVQHPAVDIAAVIAGKDPVRGEMPVAFVQLNPHAETRPTENELKSFVRERIAPYKTPRDIIFMDELPKSPAGKVLKRDLIPLLPK